ncbi:MAG TPA: membrane protein insertion efficiency factor YidD [Paenalcaligenes sp.]|nr:membrane protein insertion efficiency factor YidD [Paenalcaligenes sp.]
MLSKILIGCIRFYQYVISPWLKPSCRFHPTCSSYSIQAIQTHGALKGLALTGRRLFRCHPWGSSGYDPVPPVNHMLSQSHKHSSK